MTPQIKDAVQVLVDAVTCACRQLPLNERQQGQCKEHQDFLLSFGFPVVLEPATPSHSQPS